jgi:hypothetical protein
MKHDKNDSLITLVVEPTDERAAVIGWLVQLPIQQLPIVIVLPQDADFRRPGDLRELQQAMVQRNLRMILVIEGNERLRLWARQHGFTVFSSPETCFKALSQWGVRRSSSGRTIAPAKSRYTLAAIEQLPVTWETRTRSVTMSRTIDTPGETYQSAVAVDYSRKTTGYVMPAPYHSYVRDTEPLLELDMYEYSPQPQSLTFAQSEAALDCSLDELAPPNLEPVQIGFWPTFWTTYLQSLLRDRLLLFLVTLVVLGTLGGVGLSYLAETTQVVSGSSAHISLMHITMVEAIVKVK